MSSGIYKIINLVNGKFYIGSSVDIERRWKEHVWDLKKGNHDNQKLQASFNKYGLENFKFEIVQEIENKTDILVIEQEWLDKSGCLNRKTGFNIANKALGGHGPQSEETKRKISEAQKGIPKSEEMKKKLSEIAKNRIVSKETGLKISKGNKGKIRSLEARANIRLGRLGKKFPRVKKDTTPSPVV